MLLGTLFLAVVSLAAAPPDSADAAPGDPDASEASTDDAAADTEEVDEDPYARDASADKAPAPTNPANASTANASPADTSTDEVDDTYPRVVGDEAFFDRRKVDAVVVRPQRFFFEAAALMSTQTAVAGAGTDFEGSPAVRGGMWFPILDLGPIPVVAGFDVAAGGNFRTAGTKDISSSQALALGEGRGLIGLDLELPLMVLTPYAHVGIVAGAGLSNVTAYGESQGSPAFVLGTRGGIGLQIRWGWFMVRLDTAVGVRNGRLEVVSSFAPGLIF